MDLVILESGVIPNRFHPVGWSCLTPSLVAITYLPAVTGGIGVVFLGSEGCSRLTVQSRLYIFHPKTVLGLSDRRVQTTFVFIALFSP